jgi:hypothetical protein
MECLTETIDGESDLLLETSTPTNELVEIAVAIDTTPVAYGMSEHVRIAHIDQTTPQ